MQHIDILLQSLKVKLTLLVALYFSMQNIILNHVQYILQQISRCKRFFPTMRSILYCEVKQP